MLLINSESNQQQNNAYQLCRPPPQSARKLMLVRASIIRPYAEGIAALHLRSSAGSGSSTLPSLLYAAALSCLRDTPSDTTVSMAATSDLRQIGSCLYSCLSPNFGRIPCTAAFRERAWSHMCICSACSAVQETCNVPAGLHSKEWESEVILIRQQQKQHSNA